MQRRFLGKPHPVPVIRSAKRQPAFRPRLLLFGVFFLAIAGSVRLGSGASDYAAEAPRSISAASAWVATASAATDPWAGGPCANFKADTIFPILPASVLDTDPAKVDQCTPAFWDFRVIRVIIWKVLKLLNWASGALAVLLTVYAGLLYVLGFASEANVKTAKKVLISAYLGFAIVLSSFFIVDFSIRQVTGQGQAGALDAAKNSLE